jgi:hypothetical protein
MFRPNARRALLVSTLALAALFAVHGSTGAQPSPDDDPDYSAPYWIYANPAGNVAFGTHVDAGFIQPIEPPGVPLPHWDDESKYTAGR